MLLALTPGCSGAGFFGSSDCAPTGKAGKTIRRQQRCRAWANRARDRRCALFQRCATTAQERTPADLKRRSRPAASAKSKTGTRSRTRNIAALASIPKRSNSDVGNELPAGPAGARLQNPAIGCLKTVPPSRAPQKFRHCATAADSYRGWCTGYTECGAAGRSRAPQLQPDA